MLKQAVTGEGTVTKIKIGMLNARVAKMPAHEQRRIQRELAQVGGDPLKLKLATLDDVFATDIEAGAELVTKRQADGARLPVLEWPTGTQATAEDVRAAVRDGLARDGLAPAPKATPKPKQWTAEEIRRDLL